MQIYWLVRVAWYWLVKSTDLGNFFCCYFFVSHKIARITVKQSNFIWARYWCWYRSLSQSAGFSANRSFPRLWWLSSLEFQLESSHQRCLISSIMFISESELLLSLKLYYLSTYQFVIFYLRVLIGPYMFSSQATRHKGKTEAKSWGTNWLINTLSRNKFLHGTIWLNLSVNMIRMFFN